MTWQFLRMTVERFSILKIKYEEVSKPRYMVVDLHRRHVSQSVNYVE